MLKAVMTTTLAIGLATSALADHHEPQGGGVVAMQAHYCTLNAGKDMADVNQALAGWRKWTEDYSYNGWTAELTPQFDIAEGYDFYWLNFLPCSEMAGVLDNWAETGAAAQQAIDQVASCKVALYGSRLKYPLVDESDLQTTKVLHVESCNMRENVDMSTLLARHDDFVELNEEAQADYIWNIVWPMAGVPETFANGQKRTDFAHMVWYPSLTSQMAALDGEANGSLRKELANYRQAFADCTGRNSYGVKIIHTPKRPWN